MEWLGDLHWTLCSVGIGAAALFAVALEVRRRRIDAAGLSEQRPPIDVLKPFDGSDPGLEANFRAALTAPYGGPRQVLFATSADNQDGIALVERLLAEPRPEGVEAKLLLPPPDEEPWPARKAWHLDRCVPHLQAPVTVIGDSGTRLQDHSLDGVVATVLARDDRGVAWSPYAVEGRTLGARLTRAVWTAGAASISVLDAERALFGLARFPAGGLMAMRRQALDDAGGFAPLGDQIADDFVLGRRIGDAGWAVVPARHPILRGLHGEGLGHAWRRQLRWAVALWASRHPVLAVYPLFAGGLALASLTFLGATAAFPERALEYGLGLLALLGARLAFGTHLRTRILGRPPSLDLLLLPLGDALLVGAWLAAPFVRTLDWRGRRVRIGRGGSLIPVDQSGASTRS